MSYDFRLVRPRAGRSAEELANADADAGDREPTAAEVAGMRRIRDALLRHDSHLAVLGEDGDDADAGCIELNDTRPDRGVQLSLFPDEASVAIPYWHRGETAREVFAAVGGYLSVMRKSGGLVPYDQQVGRVIAANDSLAESRETYERTLARMQPVPAGAGPKGPFARLFPEKLDRLQYLVRWLVLTATCWMVLVGLLQLVKATAAEPLVFVPMVAWLAAKIIWLDPARLRSIGWSPRLTLITLFPPAGLFLQFLLFVVA